MPLNEARNPHSNLTEKQQREAQSAIYGLTERDPMSPTEFSYEERVRMRQMLDAMDQKDARSATKEFDLNKPPQAPYMYKEFPFLMYHHGENRTKAALNHEDRERMLAEGWSMQPFGSAGAEIPLTAAEHEEAEEINRKLDKRRRT